MSQYREEETCFQFPGRLRERSIHIWDGFSKWDDPLASADESGGRARQTQPGAPQTKGAPRRDGNARGAEGAACRHMLGS